MNHLPAEKNRRVLVIDDNRAIHDDFRKILSPATAATLEASETALFGGTPDTVPQIRFEVDSDDQGQEGVRRVEEALAAGRRYALAFVDVRMPPGWDGVETTRRIWQADPDVQIVLCTAYSDYSWGEMFEKLGHSDGLLILKKPFDAVEAFQLAHTLTEKWWLQQQSRRKTEELEVRVAERTRQLDWKTAFLEAQVDSSLDGVLIVDQEGKKSLQNQRFVDLFKMPQHIADEKADENRLRWVTGMTNNPEPFVARVVHLYAHPEEISRDEITLKDGTILDQYSGPVVGKDGKYYGRIWTFRDITERKRLEAQVFQAQKMETVGKLAGGIAHEFNSLLTAIIGQSELLLANLPAASPFSENVTEIHQAADRAAMLTRQLLAYGRKQFLRQETLNLNKVIAAMDGALRHLMGAGVVDVNIVPAAGLHWVKVDAGQIEQVIMNLAMNARDAMPHGGKLTLETANVSFDQESVSHYPELKPGDYVMLTITDTGTGIREDLKARVFEPFFTTKGIGQGSGLGLSTSYGIIKQSGGHLSLHSEPGRGTTCKIYLPRVEPQTKISLPHPASPDLPRGTETVLLVENDSALREMAVTLLRRLGYTVLAAANGIEALGLIPPRNAGPIDLLFTVVVMPHMSGRELADRVQALYPHVKILFTSAYPEHAIVHQYVLNSSVALLQQPFTPSALARKVREVLDQPIQSPPVQ